MLIFFVFCRNVIVTSRNWKFRHCSFYYPKRLLLFNSIRHFIDNEKYDFKEYITMGVFTWSLHLPCSVNGEFCTGWEEPCSLGQEPKEAVLNSVHERLSTFHPPGYFSLARWIWKGTHARIIKVSFSLFHFHLWQCQWRNGFVHLKQTSHSQAPFTSP